MKKVGVLTGGGDAPGLNAVIRGLVTRLSVEKSEPYQVIGFKDGWKGFRDNLTTPLNAGIVDEILHQGGTMLGSSRTNLYKNPDDIKKAIDTYKKNELDALVAVGGDDTLEIGYYLNRDYKLNVVGVPKTIDNDVCGTDFTFGFWSSVEQATQLIDDLRDTTKSHHRCMVVECMGRHAGWITAYTGLASEADFIAVPERPVHVDDIANAVKAAGKDGKQHSIVVVAEGASIKGIEATPKLEKKDGQWVISEKVERDSFGNTVLRAGEVAEAVAKAVEKQTKIETRAMALGHLQRGGAPCAYDRVLGTRYGIAAAEAIVKKHFGHIVVLQGLHIETVAMTGMVRENQTEHKRYKLLPDSFMDTCDVFHH